MFSCVKTPRVQPSLLPTPDPCPLSFYFHPVFLPEVYVLVLTASLSQNPHGSSLASRWLWAHGPFYRCNHGGLEAAEPKADPGSLTLDAGPPLGGSHCIPNPSSSPGSPPRVQESPAFGWPGSCRKSSPQSWEPPGGCAQISATPTCLWGEECFWGLSPGHQSPRGLLTASIPEAHQLSVTC